MKTHIKKFSLFEDRSFEDISFAKDTYKEEGKRLKQLLAEKTNTNIDEVYVTTEHPKYEPEYGHMSASVFINNVQFSLKQSVENNRWITSDTITINVEEKGKKDTVLKALLQYANRENLLDSSQLTIVI